MLSEWCFLNENEIRHFSGFRLELIAGSWHDPLGLNPVIPSQMNYVEVAILFRKGIDFAGKQEENSMIGNILE